MRTFVHGGFSTCILVPSLWFCRYHFMKSSVSGDMTSRPRSSVSVDAPGAAGTSLRISAAVASDPSTERRCVGSRPSSVDQSYLSMAGRTHSRCLPLSTCSLVVPDTTWASSAAGGDCGGLPRVGLSTLVGARSPAACVDIRIRTGRRRFRSPGAFAGDRVFLGSDSGFDSRWVRWMGAFVLAESVQ